MTAELTYSEEALRNRAIFIKNEINIYVEDIGKEYFYEELFCRLLDGKYKINAVFPLGGKPNVLKEYIRKGEIDPDGKPNIFLLDGDFDRYIGYPEVTKENFKGREGDEQALDEFVKHVIVKSDSVIYLDTYNIRSLIIEEKPVVKFVQGKIQKSESVVTRTIDFKNWKEEVINESKDLFLLYSFINKYLYLYGTMYDDKTSSLSIATVSKATYNFLNKETVFNKQFYMQLKDKISNDLMSERPELDLDDEINKIDLEYQQINGKDYYNLICGKFLLNSLNYHLSRVCGKQFDLQMLKWDLVRNFDIEKLNFINNHIKRLA